MKIWIVLAGLALAPLAHAQFAPLATLEDAFKAVPVCSGAVATDGTHVARIAAPGQLTVNGVGDFEAFDLAIDPAATDLKIKDGVIYVLLPTKIQEWSLDFKEMKFETTTIENARAGFREGANAMEFAGDKLIIAHGRKGYAIYDTLSHKITESHEVLRDLLPLESALVDVKINGDQAIFLADGYTFMRSPGLDMPFRGFVIVDLASNKEIHRTGGLGPNAQTLELSGGLAIVGFNGPTQSFNLAEVTGRADVQARVSVTQYPKQGYPIGQPAIVGDKLFSCFLESGPNIPKKFSPMVLDLSAFRP